MWFKHVDFLVCFDGDVLLLAFLVVFEKEKKYIVCKIH